MADDRHVGKYLKCHNYQWTNWNATWVVVSHHVLDMSAVLRLPCQRSLLSNGALSILQWRLETERVNKF